MKKSANPSTSTQAEAAVKENQTVTGAQDTPAEPEVTQVQVLQPGQTPVDVAQLNALEARLNDRISRSAGGKTGMLWTLTIIALAAAAYNGFTAFKQEQRLLSAEQTQLAAVADIKNAESRYLSGIDKVDSAFKLIEQRSNDVNRANDNVMRLQNEHAQLAADDRKIAETVNALLEQSKTNADSISAISAKVDRFEERDPQDWLLAESFFLVNEAARKAVFEKDPASAVWMLTKADELISTLNDEKIIALREVIAKDINLLKQIKTVDLHGLSIELDQAYNMVDKLVFNEYIAPETAFVKSSKPTENIADWKENLKSSASDFASRFIEVRRRDSSAVTEFLTPEQSHYVRENIRTSILLAKSDLNHGDKESMQNNLKRAADLTAAYFNKEDGNTKLLLESLSKVAGSEIAVQTPKVLDSANAFSAFAGDHLLGRGK